MTHKLFYPSTPCVYRDFICMQDLSLWGKASNFEVQKDTQMGTQWLPLKYGDMIKDTDVLRTVNKAGEKSIESGEV